MSDTSPSHCGAAPTRAGQPLRRIMLIQRERNNKPVPPHRRAASTADAVARVEAACARHGISIVSPDSEEPIDFVLVLGGDGTILRACERARDHHVPLLGINTGHVGFLAEADPDVSIDRLIDELVAGHYTVEERMTLRVDVYHPDGNHTHSWALNEAAIEKRDRARMLEVAIGVDGQAVSSFGCDGLIAATPTGSTAYAFSCGGPVIWPDVEALLMVPIAAHALFTRPLVLGPHSCLDVVVQHAGSNGAEVWLDGRRCLSAPAGCRIDIRRDPQPALLARLSTAPFSSRLVEKFDLPIDGWRQGGSA